MIALAVGLGLVLNFLFFELLGLNLGGMVIPGFIALEIHYPLRVVITVALSISVYVVIKLLSNFMLIYGRRHLIIAILMGFLLTEILNKMPVIFNYSFRPQIVGFILPGIIAYWMERQGIINTICSMIIGSVLIHLVLIIITGGKIFL